MHTFLCSTLPILSLSGVDRHVCIYQCFSVQNPSSIESSHRTVLCELSIELVFFHSNSGSVRPTQYEPSSRFLPSHLHRGIFPPIFIEVSSLPPSSLLLPLQSASRIFSSHGHTIKCVYVFCISYNIHNTSNDICLSTQARHEAVSTDWPGCIRTRRC